MKGDGGRDGGDGFRDFLSLGSSRSSRFSFGRNEEGLFAGRVGDEQPNLATLSSLSRDGLSMLAGGSHGGFTLKPLPVGNLSRTPGVGINSSLGRGGERTGGGGGFTGFYGAKVPLKPTWPRSLPTGMGFRAFNEEMEARDAAGASPSRRECSGNVGIIKPEQPLRTDVENLTPEECWKLVLKLGKRWPTWNRTTASPSPHGLVNERGENLDLGRHSRKVLDGARLGHSRGSEGLQFLGQEAFKVLTTRALEALAQTPPDRYGRSAGTMRAPKLTTQQFCNTKAARDCTSQSAAHSTLAASPRQPAKPPSASPPLIAATPATSSARVPVAPLTIFYDGKVIVCDNVPEDKAHFIMLFAERSSISPNAQAPAPSASCGAPSTSASPHATPDPVAAPQECARPQEELQSSQPSSAHSIVVPVIPSVPKSHLAPSRAPPDCSSSDNQKPIESSSNPAEVAPPPVPCKVSVTEGSSRQLMQQCLNGPMSKPLPNARRSSLARFLDSRKRPTASSSEEQGPSKKQELGPSDGLPSDADGTRGGGGKSPSPLSGQSSIQSKEGITAMFTNDAEMKPI